MSETILTVETGDSEDEAVRIYFKPEQEPEPVLTLSKDEAMGAVENLIQRHIQDD